MTPWIFGGDFNHFYGHIDPVSGNTPTAEWYYTHDEIHLPSDPNTITSGGKIDYLFADR